MYIYIYTYIYTHIKYDIEDTESRNPLTFAPVELFLWTELMSQHKLSFRVPIGTFWAG